ncbi:MAG: carboxypeptidase regulatory-like domain-containing protein [Methanobacteriota archaeon]
MDEGTSWWRTHWRTALALVLIFGFALFLRFYFVYGLAFTTLAPTCDGQGTLPVSGGSDSYYWHRALCYSFETGKDLTFDAMLNYGPGLFNPRPPLFPWFSLLTGQLLTPIFGDPWLGVLYVFLASTGLFGALTVFPTYAVTKEAFGRRAGLVAALLFAISSAHLQRSQATDADHDAFTLFFVVATFYFFLRSLKVLPDRRWVETWFRRGAIVAGVRAFFREGRPSVLYAILAGLCIAVIALSWQGWAYVPVILIVYFAVQLFLDRVRNQDTMGLTVLFSIAMIVPLVVGFPWYATRFQIRVWFDVPAYLFLVAAVLGVVFTVTRDYPWTLVIPATLVAGGLGLAVGVLVNPALASAFVSGAGYFVQTKVYETIAEAQAPGLSQLILSFGFFTFYVSVAGVAYMLWLIPRRRDPAYTVLVIWAFAAIFMAMAAARFIFNASPAFAVTAAFAIDLVLTRADFTGMRRTYRSLAQGSWRNAIRKSLKIRHVLAALMVVGIVLVPNVYWGIDSGIPFELKSTYDRQLHEALPSFLRAPGYNPAGGGSFYFGAFGYSLPEPTEYFPAAWQWFRTMDRDRPAEQRPAFLSWWDYGFEAVDRGQHPTVADNFQNGFAFAGQFITATGETQAIALLAVRSLEGDFRRNRGALGEAAEDVLVRFGFSAGTFERAIGRPQDFVAAVQADPATYGRWDADMQPLNAMYIYLARQVTLRLDADRVADFYKAVRAATGIDIGYFAVDSRLFPISAQNTGIFYAPVKLSDHRVVELPDGRTLPTEFFRILVETDRGEIPLENVGPGDTVRSQRIEYETAFYDSMFYRAYVGYAPADLGQPTDRTIPGFSQSLVSFPPVPAWNLSHFRLVYRTSYYNPFDDPANHSDAWRAVNFDEAQLLQKEIQDGSRDGVVDLSSQASVTNGIVFLRYYDGAWVNGTVRAGGATPVSGVRVTVTDELGTPHDVATTDASGRYSVLVPFGNVTLTASVGTPAPGSLVGSQVLATATFPVSLEQALRENVDEDGDGTPDWLMTRDLTTPGRAASGTAFFDLSGDGSFGALDAVAPGASITLTHQDLDFVHTATAGADGTFALPPVPTGGYAVLVTAAGHTVSAADLDLGTSEGRQDIAVPFATLEGFATDDDGQFLAGARIEVLDEATGDATRLTTSDAGFYEARPLLEGNYTITATLGDLATNPDRLRVTRGTSSLNLTLVPSGRVAGVTRLFGLDMPFASLEFQKASEVRLVRTVRSDGSASLDVSLPAGEWNVNGRLYQGTALYATLGRISVRAGETTAFVARFVDGARIDGVVNGTPADGPQVRAQIAFLGASGEWWVRTGDGGGYLAYLPRGAYGIQAFSPTSAFYGDVALTSSRTLNIQLAAAISATARAFRDVNDNGAFDAGEGVAGATIRLTDDLGRRVLAVADDAGSFQLFGFANRTYAGTIEGSGFETAPIGPSTLAEIRATSRYALVPTPVEVHGSVLLGGVPLLKEIAIVARAVADGASAVPATTDSNGGFFLNLLPGRYEIVVDENVSTSRDFRYQNLGTDAIRVPVASAGIVRDVEVVVRTRITGNVTRNGTAVTTGVTFEGPDGRSVTSGPTGYEVYLQSGTYSVSASLSAPPDELAFLDAIDVGGPVHVSLALARAAKVSGLALYRNVAVPAAMPISFVRAEGGSLLRETTGSGSYATVLVPGNYTVRLDAERALAEGSLTRFYRFTFTGSLVVVAGAPDVTFHLNVERELDNTTVAGRVARAGVGVDASLTFLARGAGALDAVASSGPEGTYAVGLAPGSYDVHVTRSLGSSAFLGSLTVAHANASTFDVPLSSGFRLVGVVTDALGARTSAAVTIQGEARLDLTTDASGAYERLLPLGTYTVTATKSGTERGLAVDYRATATVELTSDSVVNLKLAKVERRSVALTWDPAQRQSLSPGGSVVYSVVVRNTGNVRDTFALSGRPGEWTFTFSPATVTLDFGATGNAVSVTVTLRAPADAQVVHAPTSVVATSSDGTTTGFVNVDVDVRRTRGLSLRVLASSATFDGRTLQYALEVRNSGNAQEAVTVFVANPGDLALSGWTALLGREGGLPPSSGRLETFPVGANGTTRVTLHLTSTDGPSGVTVVLQAFLDDAPTVTATAVHVAELPSLAPVGGVQASGPNVVGSATVPATLLTIVVAVAAAAAVALLLTRRRG